MTEFDGSMEEKIIDAAVECLEKFGVGGTTNRAIAKAAGINSAAINYYFRSKDVLIQKVMERTMDNAFDWSDFEDVPGSTPKERCFAIFDHLVQGGINFPGITRAHFYDLLTTGDYDALVVKRLNSFAIRLVDDLLAHGYMGSRADLEMTCMLIMNAAFMSVMVPKLYKDCFGIELKDPETRTRMIHTLVDRLL